MSWAEFKISWVCFWTRTALVVSSGTWLCRRWKWLVNICKRPRQSLTRGQHHHTRPVWADWLCGTLGSMETQILPHQDSGSGVIYYIITSKKRPNEFTLQKRLRISQLKQYALVFTNNLKIIKPAVLLNKVLFHYFY